MAELTKIKRVVARFDAAAPHEVILVLDAGVGQNAISQLKEFDAAVGLTGLVVTKLDGTAKAGILFGLAHAMQEAHVMQEAHAMPRERPLPVYYIGIGEQIDDLRRFEAAPFVDVLLDGELAG